VPWSSQPIPGCALANTWTYEQTLKNTGGRQITISDRTDFFDGAQTGTRSGLAIILDPGQENKITTRWCSANATEHRTQTNFNGRDSSNAPINFDGPPVRLMAR
jgi:hypothetical protein